MKKKEATFGLRKTTYIKFLATTLLGLDIKKVKATRLLELKQRELSLYRYLLFLLGEEQPLEDKKEQSQKAVSEKMSAN